MATGRRKQSGQALIYGLFMLAAGLAALFFLFNVSQLTREKTKLLNTSDAVAYSAGVMHARAMNFAAYTNRALVANEVAIAQMVSLASWGKYLVEHGQSALFLGCDPGLYYGVVNEPTAEGMPFYAPICEALGYASSYGALDDANEVIQGIGPAVVTAAEASKLLLEKSQIEMISGMWDARKSVMQDVATANYLNDGLVEVADTPLRDDFLSFKGKGKPIIYYYTGDDRTPMRDLVVSVVNKDGFTASRSWSDTAAIPALYCSWGFYQNYVDRSGGTQLIGFDQWQAADQATYNRWKLKLFSGCKVSGQSLGTGNQSASSSGSSSSFSDNWSYSGIPSFAELSADALNDPDPAAPDPRVQFAVRVLRPANQTRTSDARADIKTTPRLNAYNNAASGQVYVGLSASETFFQRPAGRTDGNKELASLFNPYWQTHLIEVPAVVRTAAQALQGVVLP